MEVISLGGVVVLILATLAALFLYGVAGTQGWTGSKGL
jgi:hypothetical protein